MRQVRRLLSTVLVLLGAIIVVPTFGGTASAHHSNISASVACNGTVSWTATSWATGPAGTNPDIRVFKTVGNTTTQIGQGAFTNANNYQFSGTFSWPANTTSITVTSKPYGTWGNGTVSPVGSSTTITKPTNCPGQPGVSKAVSCTNTSPGNGDSKVVLTLTNSAGQFGSAVTFKVFNPDQTVLFTSYLVANGATTPVTFTGLADGNHTVKILVGTTDYSQTFAVDCDSPVPVVTRSVTCANGDGQVVVTLSNTGGEAVVFDVTNPTTGVVEHVTVNANSSTTRTFGGFADGDHTVVIRVGTADFSQTFTVDCDHPQPKVSSTVVCDNTHDGSVVVTLANTGTEAVVFHVTDPNTGIVENVSVAAGGSTTRTFGGLTDGAHSVTVTADGQDFTQSFTVHCDLDPSFSHSETCTNGDGSVNVTMTNNGDDVDALFVLDGVPYTLAPGATKVVTLSGLTDGSHLVPLMVNGIDKSFTVIVDCDRPGQPAVEIAQSCATEDGVVVVTLKNIGGQLPLTFTVQGTDYVVPANSKLDVPVTGLLDGPQTITITQGDTDFSKPVTIGCDKAPTVTVTQTCVEGAGGISDGQVVVTLHNNGDDVIVTFTVDGDQYPVGPKASLPVTIGSLPDGPNHIDVFVGDLDLGFDVTVACDHPGEGSVSSTADCADNDGLIIVTLAADGGELPVVFNVDGVNYPVAPDETVEVSFPGLDDGSHHISIFVGELDLSIDVATTCDLPPLVDYVQSCANFDDSVSVVLTNQGDDTDVTFTINGTDYDLAPGETRTVLVDQLADGSNTITVAINGVPQDDIVVESDCDPVVMITPVCNSVDTEGEIARYWFTILNTEATDVSLTWDGGGATVPAGQTITIATTSASLVVRHNGAVIGESGATETTCVRTVNFTKELQGHPETGETYSIRVSRLVGQTYVEELTFNLNGGETKTVSLPSTLDPAGIDYKIEEIVAGTANTSVVSPDQMKLSGHLGETVSVVVTNGYASVQIDKTSSTSAVILGGQITYTLQGTNTGGLTLNPVVVTDRLPVVTELVSASVAGGAGQCALAQATRPQLLSCTMSGALAPGAATALITVVVKVDGTVTPGTTIVNQASVHGAYTGDPAAQTLAQQVNTAGAAGGDLSCVPVIAGTVCDLSAKVGVPVAQQQASSAPPAASSSDVVSQLPRTGFGHLGTMLALALGGVLLGGALLLSRRRFGVR